ncbi:nucleotide-binding universal stress UspA family protein [Saccharopolyspora erythraea NRRL 2338]|uniref:UspA domain protein n=3 Tax=Saccharopolyspora erythraea TaxID=1836 RepID=A4FIB1_SACEN|nr:universal stress protein [Saccharopolyspora erythraea]EQD81348.1 stress-inducible protein [Saccharopolyspora erythraea D]PFG97464.1 nucleotide-binding universal stress UspA family protein [Saccharopolyspora erythraea NRRL 2338]QRK87643.1 universal stress protein [Saccharopolyspora erythraea]CAM03786.1 UspA domain protein [Saccharopolyspora erythraea NRRL 2338]
MTTTEERVYTIVVGIDGSPASKEALRWALWHAGLTRGSVTALMAWDTPLIYNWEVPGLEDFAATTARYLDEVINKVGGQTSVSVSKEVAQAHPARALLDAARDKGADLLVVGNRGRGGLTEAELLRGSVASGVLHHARCPVAVVREAR